MPEDLELISLIKGIPKLNLRTEVLQELLETASIWKSIIMLPCIAIFTCFPFIISTDMTFLFGYSLFAGMSANMEALWTMLVRRIGDDAMKGPLPKKSRGGQEAPALIPQALVVDLEAPRVTKVTARQGNNSFSSCLIFHLGWSVR